jgi:AraC family transcriptional regulator of adaptative response/methylated-DNA-[protein]-cysteine methyltransferase
MLYNPEMRSVATSWGCIRLEFTRMGLLRCTLPRLDGIPHDHFAVLEAGDDPYSKFICDLFEGKDPPRPSMDQLQGTPFQRSVWQGILNIPRGKTVSYQELAEGIGHARAARAAANACGRNPAPLFVPCHRVIRTDGAPGGFSCGPAWKRLLLAVEQISR